jgi:hypothetical protein
VCKEFFELKHVNENLKYTYKYHEYRKFIHLYNRYETGKDSTLTLRLDTEIGEMIFLLILRRWNIYVM